MELNGQTLGHEQAQGMFAPLLDSELSAREEQTLVHHLDGCKACERGFTKYARAVERVRGVSRERAPADFAQLVLRRVRRRRRKGPFALHGGRLIEQYAISAEAALPIILAAVVAVVLLLSAP